MKPQRSKNPPCTHAYCLLFAHYSTSVGSFSSQLSFNFFWQPAGTQFESPRLRAPTAPAHCCYCFRILLMPFIALHWCLEALSWVIIIIGFGQMKKKNSVIFVRFRSVKKKNSFVWMELVDAGGLLPQLFQRLGTIIITVNWSLKFEVWRRRRRIVIIQRVRGTGL